jgi:hypothetical protein
MPDAKDDLRATSEAIQDDAHRLANLEARKLSLDPADPEVDRLSHEIQQLVRTIGHKAAAESELAEEIGEAETSAGQDEDPG